jgi:cytochrome c oxidase subunit II
LKTGARPARKIKPRAAVASNDRRKEVTVVKPAVFLAAIFLALSLAAGGAESPRRIEIIAKRFTYEPDAITLKRGEPVVLVLHSIDVTHGLKIDALNVKSDDIKKGKDTELRFTPEKTGHYVGQCAHFCGKGHGDMKLQIDVVE